MKLFVRLMSGKTITLDDVIPANDTIDGIKAMIEEKEEIPKAQQLLILGGRELDGNRTLYHHNIGEEYTLTLVVVSF